MSEDNVIFSKGYRPPVERPMAVAQPEAQMLNCEEGFFDGLTMLDPKQLRKKSGISFISKRQRMEN